MEADKAEHPAIVSFRQRFFVKLGFTFETQFTNVLYININVVVSERTKVTLPYQNLKKI